MFSEDKWVGGIESDISTVVTYVAAERWLKRGGTLAFLITGTVFANESSQGFRRFEITRLKLPADYPATFRYLKRFRRILEQRSSFRRFQKKQAWWSLWSTGAYSFARYKVAWREMPGGRFAAAIVAPVRHPLLGKKLVVLDHKLYFVPCKSLKEAAFLTALLNAPIVSEAISAYAAQLSLGVSVVEYLALPRFNSKDSTHRALVSLALRLTQKVGVPSQTEWDSLDSLTRTAFNLP